MTAFAAPCYPVWMRNTLIISIATCLSLLAACTTSGGGTNGGTTTVPGQCPDPGSVAMEHSGFITADQTWGPGLHLVTSNVNVRAGVKLTVAPCAVVRFAADQSLVVQEDANGLVAEGTATQPIVFERAAATQPWGAIVGYAPATLRLAYATISGGGTSSAPASAEFAGAALVGRNQQDNPADVLRVDHVTVTGATGLGVMLDSAGFIAGSTDLTVSGAGTFPIYLAAAAATRLPVGTYTGNGTDAFLLQSVGVAVYGNDEPIIHDATLPARGLPYQVGLADTKSDIRVGDSRPETPGATLTIEPGVELRFGDAGQLLVRGHLVGKDWLPQGVLVAVGTADKPIVLTSASATPAPGAWRGVYFENAVDPASAIANVHIAYAGGDSGTTGQCVASMGASNFDADCAIILSLTQAPPHVFISQTRIENGHGCGIYRGWTGTMLDFAPTNTFLNLTGCDQSNVHSDQDGCKTGSCQ